jgi:diguanylate cyclase (GGDEF)-like protein
MAGMTRVVLAAVSASLACIPVAMLWSSAVPHDTSGRVPSVLAGFGGAGCAVLWILRWPTRSESVAFAVAATASIAMGVLAQTDPTIALLCCTAFATISGYIAMFHTALLMSTTAVVIVVVAVIPAVALASTGGVVRAACEYGLVLVVNVAVPYGIQIFIHALGGDLLEADRDPLTGLLNRRAFYERTGRLVAAGGVGDELVVAVIDLDRFKQLNDARGHATGDLALVAVGRALLEHTRAGAVVARAGGEEFLVADVFAHPESDILGQRLCDAVAALSFSITASVGTANARCDRIVHADDSHAAIGALIATADEAMYDAKRNGGNRTRHQLGPRDEVSN